MNPTRTAPDETPAPPSPRAAGEIEECTMWQKASETVTCENILTIYMLSFDVFYKMNPSVGKDCSKMSLGTYYCLSTHEGGVPPGIPGSETTGAAPPSTTTTVPGATPSPIQDDMIKTCNKFYEVKKGDVCGDIAKKYKISDADFLKWNPAVKKDCTGLIAEMYVCVGIK